MLIIPYIKPKAKKTRAAIENMKKQAIIIFPNVSLWPSAATPYSSQTAIIITNILVRTTQAS